MSKIGVLILAAGSSSRMGKIKQLLPYKHTTLLGWTIEQAQASVADEVLCVLGANATEIRVSIKNYKVKTSFNPNYKDGLSSSIVSGIKALENLDAVLILLADQPFVTSAYLNRLLSEYQADEQRIIASNYERSLGVPAVFPKKYFDELKKLSGDKGAKGLLEKYRSELVKVDSENLIDIDTLDDYLKIID